MGIHLLFLSKYTPIRSRNERRNRRRMRRRRKKEKNEKERARVKKDGEKKARKCK